MKLRKRAILIGVFAIALLAGVTGAVVYGLREPAEPMYEGKPLSEVLLAFFPGKGNYDTEYKRAEAAMAKFGTNTVPTLLRMLRAHDSPLSLKLDMVGRKLGLIRKPFVPAFFKNHAGGVAFGLLPPSKKIFVPDLVRIYDQKISVSSQLAVLEALADIGPAAAALGTPAILNAMSHPEANMRMTAVYALTNVSMPAAIAVPLLTNALTDSTFNVQMLACFALESYGDSAKPAVPALIDALNNQILIGLHKPAANALKAIDTNAYDRLVAAGKIVDSSGGP